MIKIFQYEPDIPQSVNSKLNYLIFNIIVLRSSVKYIVSKLFSFLKELYTKQIKPLRSKKLITVSWQGKKLPIAASRCFFFSIFSSLLNGFLNPSSAVAISLSLLCAARRSSKLPLLHDLQYFWTQQINGSSSSCLMLSSSIGYVNI